tara:strand:- start:729 stop:1550 length:822 start_codon:yes stop_codon:yes gene_type:complete
MKFRHNKKRNTAFLFEALVKELTKVIVKNNLQDKNKIIDLIKENFKKDSTLAKELEIYKSLLESKNLSKRVAEKLVYESKRQYDSLDKEEIFESQSALIRQINKTLSKNIFSNFVPQYKNIATVYQLFNEEEGPKKRVILEETLIEQLSTPEEILKEKLVPDDKLVFKTFTKNFNSIYSKNLHEEQKQLLNKYVTSFSDNGVEFKIFLNEEVGRLKNEMTQSLESESVKSDPAILKKTQKVINTIKEFKDTEITSSMIQKIMKIQSLVKEIQN